MRGETIGHALLMWSIWGDPWHGGVTSHDYMVAHYWHIQLGTMRSLLSQGRGHPTITVSRSPQEGGFRELQYRHMYLCEVTVGCVYHGEVSEERSKVGYHALYCTGSLEVKLVEQKILLDHYQLNNTHQITWRAEVAKLFAEWAQKFCWSWSKANQLCSNYTNYEYITHSWLHYKSIYHSIYVYSLAGTGSQWMVDPPTTYHSYHLLLLPPTTPFLASLLFLEDTSGYFPVPSYMWANKKRPFHTTKHTHQVEQTWSHRRPGWV